MRIAMAFDSESPALMRTGRSAIIVLVLTVLFVPSVLRAQETPPPAKAPEQEKAQPENSAEESPDLDREALVFDLGRVVTLSGEDILDARIVVKDGLISAIGPRAEIKAPRGAKRFDHRDAVMVPGFVHPASPDFEGSPRHSFTGKNAKGSKLISGSIKASRKLTDAFAKAGYTVVCAVPSGGAIVGQGALLRLPAAGEDEVDPKDMLLDARAVLMTAFQPATSSKTAWKKHFEEAQKYRKDLEAYNKAKKSGGAKPKAESKEKQEEKKPAEGKKEEKGGEKKTESDPKKDDKDKQEEKKKPEKKKDEGPKEPKASDDLKALLEHLDGKAPAILGIQGAAAWLHFQEVLKLEPSFKPNLLFLPTSFRAREDSFRVLESIAESGMPVISASRLSSYPRTWTRLVPQRLLLDAGIPLALIPPPSSVSRVPQRGPRRPTAPQVRVSMDPRAFHDQLLELQRHGLTEREILRALTDTPARMLGLQELMGTLEEGKEANFIIFDGRPFAPTTKVLEVRSKGITIHRQESKS